MLDLALAFAETSFGIIFIICLVALFPFVLILIFKYVFPVENTPGGKHFEQNYFIDPDRKPGSSEIMREGS